VELGRLERDLSDECLIRRVVDLIEDAGVRHQVLHHDGEAFATRGTVGPAGVHDRDPHGNLVRQVPVERELLDVGVNTDRVLAALLDEARQLHDHRRGRPVVVGHDPDPVRLRQVPSLQYGDLAHADGHAERG
jgi:hypothetical protein